MGSASNTPARGNSSWSPKRGAASSSKPWRANRRSPARSSGSRSMVNAGTGTWPTGGDTVWTGDWEADVAVTTVGSVETEVASNCNTSSIGPVTATITESVVAITAINSGANGAAVATGSEAAASAGTTLGVTTGSVDVTSASPSGNFAAAGVRRCNPICRSTRRMVASLTAKRRAISELLKPCANQCFTKAHWLGSNFRSPDMIPSCGERLLRGYGETEAEVTARVVDDFCVQFLTYFRQGFRAMGR